MHFPAMNQTERHTIARWIIRGALAQYSPAITSGDIMHSLMDAMRWGRAPSVRAGVNRRQRLALRIMRRAGRLNHSTGPIAARLGV